MIEKTIEFTFYVGEFSKFRSVTVLRSLVDEVEEYNDHLVVRYSEDKDFVIHQFLILLMDHGVVARNFSFL